MKLVKLSLVKKFSSVFCLVVFILFLCSSIFTGQSYGKTAKEFEAIEVHKI